MMANWKKNWTQTYSLVKGSVTQAPPPPMATSEEEHAHVDPVGR